MKWTSKVLVMTGINLILLAQLALAGDSITLKVSCTIPEIPGVNAPPFLNQQKIASEEKAEKKNNLAEDSAEQKKEESQKNYPVVLVKEEIREEVRPANGQLAKVTIKTVYSR